MTAASKALRVFGLLLLMLAGLVAIGAVAIAYISTKVPVGLLGLSFVGTSSWDSGFVFARGTWAMEGTEHGFPLNVSELQCRRDAGLCYEAQGRISNGLLTTALEVFEIRKWDAGSLEYVTDTDCVTYVYIINRATEKLTGRRLKRDNTGEECSGVLEREIQLSLVSGFDVVMDLQQRYFPTASAVAAAVVWVVFVVWWMVRVVRRRAKPVARRQRAPGPGPI